MKFIVQVDKDGSIFAYRETDKHFKKVQKSRKGYNQLTYNDLDHQCAIIPGSLIVVDIKDKYCIGK